MPKITKEEMLEWLDFWYGKPKILFSIASDEELRAYQAICSLVKTYFKWQKQAAALWESSPTLEGFEDSVPLKKFVKEIRDFKGKK